jgi:beta-galactosidase
LRQWFSEIEIILPLLCGVQETKYLAKLSQKVVEISQMLSDYVRELDDTRPVTAAVNGLNQNRILILRLLILQVIIILLVVTISKRVFSEKTIDEYQKRISYCSESYPLKAFGAWMDVIDNSLCNW